MEAVVGVPGHLGKGPVYLAHLAAAADWPTLLTDPDWQSTAGRRVRHGRSRARGRGLTTGDPLTTWHDHEPLEQALDFFVRFRGDNTNLDVDEDHPAWQRLVLVVGDAAWFEQAEAYLHALSTRADA